MDKFQRDLFQILQEIFLRRLIFIAKKNDNKQHNEFIFWRGVACFGVVWYGFLILMERRKSYVGKNIAAQAER